MNEERRASERIELLDGEEVWLSLHERYGLVGFVPDHDDCVVLTNKRLIAFLNDGDRTCKIMTTLQNVDMVQVACLSKNTKSLINGILLALGSFVVVWLAMAFNFEGILPWLIGGIMVVLGIVIASTYFVSEGSAEITFNSHTGNMSIPLRTSHAVRDASSLSHGFFQAKFGITPTATERHYTELTSTDDADKELGATESSQRIPPPASHSL